MIFRSIIIFLFTHIYGDAMASEVKAKSAHDFVFKTIEGEHLPLSRFSGKAILIVNTASFCGFTRQYTSLQDLWQRYQSQGLIVLGVPSDDFGGQEPGTETEIKTFCETNFDISFPLTEKTPVKGPVAHPFYKWAAAELGPVAKPRWNFHKYLVTPDGRLVNWFSTPTSPVSARVIKAVESSLPH
jgi:glutathione peroxidase